MIINFAKTEQTSRIIFVSFVILSIISMLTGGCSTAERTKYSEPGIIAVQNNSGAHLSIVSLRDVSGTVEKPVRRGSVSPVPKGATQVFQRPSPPPPLPKRMIISWTDYDQGQYEREISLEKILRDPNTQTKDTLIFEIRPSGRINVFKK